MTAADFFNIERGSEAAPKSGGGQTYISISFRGLKQIDLANFIGISPPDRIITERPKLTLRDVSVAVDPSIVGDIEFASRYRLPESDDRYRITNQNRQTQRRHPAWTSTYGFPEAPDDVFSSADPRLPNVDLLKIWIAQLSDGSYTAGYVNGRPAGGLINQKMLVLFAPNDENNSAGVIAFDDLELDASDMPATQSFGAQWQGAAPEVLDAVDATERTLARTRTSQGRRQSAEQRKAIETCAVDLAISFLEAEGWQVSDVGATRSYDLHCTMADAEMRVEVKGTTSDGSSVLLTPNEVEHARSHFPATSLIVVSNVVLATNSVGEPIATGGHLAEIRPWQIDKEGTLRSTGFEYKLNTK